MWGESGKQDLDGKEYSFSRGAELAYAQQLQDNNRTSLMSKEPHCPHSRGKGEQRAGSKLQLCDGEKKREAFRVKL